MHMIQFQVCNRNLPENLNVHPHQLLKQKLHKLLQQPKMEYSSAIKKNQAELKAQFNKEVQLCFSGQKAN